MMNSETEIFQLLIEASRHNYETYLTAIWTITGSTLVALGWILTSKNARLFLTHSLNARQSLKVVIVIIAVLSIVILIFSSIKSYDIIDLLEKNEFASKNRVSPKIYAVYLIKWYQPIANGLIIISLFFILGKTVHQLKDYKEPITNE